MEFQPVVSLTHVLHPACHAMFLLVVKRHEDVMRKNEERCWIGRMNVILDEFFVGRQGLAHQDSFGHLLI